jgi:tetratricopeptide (TPR) repeat protein
MPDPQSAGGGEPVPRAKRAVLALAAALIVALGFAIFLNGIRGNFLFDDFDSIVKNPAIRQLWPSWKTVFQNARPVVERSLAVNYAIGELDTRGYHLVNIAIHVAAALALFGIVRRTLLSGPMRARFGAASLPLALAVALVWLAHPLQTESVTYVAQRAESLMGLFYLLTLYCAIRGFDSERRRAWHAAAVAFCALGMGAKEVMVTAPLIVLLYDRTFAAGSFRRALARSPVLYAGLALTWLALAALVAHAPAAVSAGFAMPLMTPGQYAMTQFGVIAHYLRLAFWPSPLILDYKWPVATVAQSLPWLLLISALIAVTLGAFRRAPAAGFLGAWFFLILAPTSSIMPIADVCVEHRMYLPLAAVAALAVCGGYALLTRRRAEAVRAEGIHWPSLFGALVLIALVAVFSGLTVRRNRDYRTEMAMWGDIVGKQPGNDRAHYNYGDALMKSGDVQEAMSQFEQALKINKDYPEAHNNLGQALASLGRVSDALPHFAEAVRLRPTDDRAQYNLANVLLAEGNLPEAAEHYDLALKLDPSSAETHSLLASILLRQGKLDDCIFHLKEAVRLRPNEAMFHCNLANVYNLLSRYNEAMAEYRAALELKPDYAIAHTGLAKALASTNSTAEAVEHYQEALRLQPDSVDVLANLAWLRATQADAHFRNGPEALKLARRAVELTGGKDIGCLEALAAACAETGSFAEAQEAAEKARGLAVAQGLQQRAEAIGRRMALYAAGKPFRQGAE